MERRAEYPDVEVYVLHKYGVDLSWADLKRELPDRPVTIVDPAFHRAVMQAAAYRDCSVEGVIVAI